jgi:large conductance mechanosensitive channel
MFREFKEFALKGSMLDLAIGIVLGAAFGTVISSMVGDVITPLLGMITGGIDFSSMFIVLKDGTPAGPYASIASATSAGANILNIGSFLNAVLSFILVALALFFVEIRDLLKEQRK